MDTTYICIDCDTDTDEYYGELVAFVSSFHPDSSIRVVHTNSEAIDSDVADGVSETDARVFHLQRSVLELQSRPSATAVAHASFGPSALARLVDSGVSCVTRDSRGVLRMVVSRKDLTSLRASVLPEWGLLNLYESAMQACPSVISLGCDIPGRVAPNGARVGNGTILFDGIPVAMLPSVPSIRVRAVVAAWNTDGARGATDAIYPRESGMPLTLALTRVIAILTASIHQRVREKHIVEKGVNKTIRIRVPSVEPSEFAEFRYTSARDIQYRQSRTSAWRPFGAVDPSAFPQLRGILSDYSQRVSQRVARVDPETPGESLRDDDDELTQLIREKREMQSDLLSQYHRINTEVKELQLALDSLEALDTGFTHRPIATE